MFFLSLVAALAGTPLRQAEAARDLARSIDELDDGSLVEEEDGGVGDDAHDAVKEAGGPGLLIGQGLLDGCLFASSAPRPDPGEPTAPTARSRSLAPPDARLRRAWLQCFRC